MLRIRPTQIEDIGIVNQLYAKGVDDPVGVQRNDWELALSETFLRSTPGLSQLAFLGDEAVGHVFAAFSGARVMFHHLYVLPGHRNRGIGSQLLTHLSIAATEQGYSQLAVGIVFEEKRNRFCERNGFFIPHAKPMYQCDIGENWEIEMEVVSEIRAIEARDSFSVSALSTQCDDPYDIEYLMKMHKRQIDFSIIAKHQGQCVGALFGENSGFRGLLVDWLVHPLFRDKKIAEQLLQSFKISILKTGVRRILAAGYPNDDYRNQALRNAGFIALPDEAIAFKELR